MFLVQLLHQQHNKGHAVKQINFKKTPQTVSILLFSIFISNKTIQAESFANSVTKAISLSSSLQYQLTETLTALSVANDFQKMLVAQKAATFLEQDLKEQKEETLEHFVLSIQKGYLEEFTERLKQKLSWSTKWYGLVWYYFSKKEYSFIANTAELVNFYCHFELSHIFSDYERTHLFFAHQKTNPFPTMLKFWQNPHVHNHLLNLIKQFSNPVKIQAEVLLDDGLEAAGEDAAEGAAGDASEDYMATDVSKEEEDSLMAQAEAESEDVSEWTDTKKIAKKAFNYLQKKLETFFENPITTLNKIGNAVSGKSEFIGALKNWFNLGVSDAAEDITEDAAQDAAQDTVDDAFDGAAGSEAGDATEGKGATLKEGEAYDQNIHSYGSSLKDGQPYDQDLDAYHEDEIPEGLTDEYEKWETSWEKANPDEDTPPSLKRHYFKEFMESKGEKYNPGELEAPSAEESTLVDGMADDATEDLDPKKSQEENPELTKQQEKINKEIEKKMAKANSVMKRGSEYAEKIENLQTAWEDLKSTTLKEAWKAPYKALKLGYRAIVRSFAYPSMMMGVYITDPIEAAYESAFGDLIEQFEDNALKEAMEKLPHWAEGPANGLLMMTVSSGGGIVTSWVSAADQQVYMKYAKQQNLMSSLNTRVGSLFNGQKIKNQKAAYSNFDTVTTQILGNKKQILSLFLAEKQFQQQSMVSTHPHSFFTVDSSDAMEQDQFFANSTMLTPDTITAQGIEKSNFGAWHDVFRSGSWQYINDEKGGYFYQTELVKITGASVLEQATQALNNRIFKEYIPQINSSYTLSFECTLLNHDDLFFMGIIFNNARWISGVPDRSHQHRFVGLFGTQGTIYQVCEESQNSPTGQKPNTQWPLYRILNNPNNYTSNPLSLKSLPTTFTITITTEPNQVSFSCVPKLNTTNQQTKPIVQSNLAPPNFHFHGIGFVAAGCIAQFKVIAPKELTYNSEQITNFKTLITAS